MRTERSQFLRAADERRLSNRLPIMEPVRYKVLGQRKGIEQIGSGNTLNMSSRGVLFSTEYLLAEESRIELAIDWPATLNGVALKLVVSGLVVRSEESRAAMSIEKYEFKTRRSNLRPDVALSRAA
jgi:hypothetical protein